jgi:hypothetical protein
MLIDPNDLAQDLDKLEGIERESLRLVTQAVLDFREQAVQIFQHERDLVQDIGEDLTREALDRMGVSRIDERLFGKTDYKRARYVFHPDYAVRQALFVDSKAEKLDGRRTATLQTTQTSLRIRQNRAGRGFDEAGTLPPIWETPKGRYLTTTIFVKYNYDDEGGSYRLDDIIVCALPNRMLQSRYNPSASDTIWLAGRNAPSRGEDFRVRLSFERLKRKCPWRVQSIPAPPDSFVWDNGH